LRFALQGPEVLSRAPRAWATAVISTVPRSALHSMRLTKRWVKQRLGRES